MPDCFSLKLHSNKTSPIEKQCTMIAIVLNNGKTNPNGRFVLFILCRIEYGGSMRAQEVEVCVHSSLALHIFARFHVFHEVFFNNF